MADTTQQGGQGQAGAHKQRVKDAMAKHTKPRDRFKAFANGVLDQAAMLIKDGATREDQLQAIDGLRAQLDEAFDDIEGKGKK